MSQSSNHLRLVSWTWQWVHFTQMASTVTRSQSSRAPLGCGGTGDSHHGCAADKSAATAWCYHVNMDQNFWEMFPTPCWIYATKNQGSPEGKGGVQFGNSKVYLIKCPVALCSIHWYDDVSSQRFGDMSIDTPGPVLIFWHVCSCGPHLIWIQEHSLKCLTPMYNLAAEEHYWVAWYKET